MTDVVGVGLVGLSAKGGWAARAHLPALAALPGYELRALAASDATAAAEAGRRYGVPRAYATVEDLVADESVDLVVVAVRADRHRACLLPALAAGKPVLCEWPLGTGLAEAEELAAAAHGTRTAVGLQARSAAPIRYLRDLVADGYVGRVLSTTMTGAGGLWGPTYGSYAAYTLDPAYGATLLSVPFGHAVDALCAVLGELRPVRALTANRLPRVRHARTGEIAVKHTDDQVVAVGLVDDDAVATVHYRGGPARGDGLRWEITGTAGELLVTCPGHLQHGPVRIRGGRDDDRKLTDLPVPARYDHSSGLAAPAGPVAEAYALLAAGDSAVPDFEHAVRRHRLLAEIAESGRAGRAVSDPARPSGMANS
ncbi:Gfo/Idh/MocA family protein [Micromonospora chalcea]